METQSVRLFDDEARVRARDSVETLQKRLPEDAINLLAKEVITRLASRFVQSQGNKVSEVSEEGIERLANLLLSSDHEAGLEMILDLVTNGVSRDQIYLGYIAGAARFLGERWNSDELPFTDVTIAAGRLYVIMRAIRPSFVGSTTTGSESAGTALFASVPGEDHTLGVTMAADMFRERGWTIDLRTGSDHDELVSVSSKGNYPVIGLSASSDRMIVPMSRLIASFRVTTPATLILVSGELTQVEPDLARIVDADSVAKDAPSAIAEMQRLLEFVTETGTTSPPN